MTALRKEMGLSVCQAVLRMAAYHAQQHDDEEERAELHLQLFSPLFSPLVN